MRALLLAPVLAFIVTWPALAPTDPDYWWHARTGQLIVETGAIPHTDVFSYTAAGQPWITHEWLTEVIFFVVQQHLGYAGNVLLVGVLGALAALALFATCRRWGVGELPAVVVLVLWAFGMSLGSLSVLPKLRGAPVHSSPCPQPARVTSVRLSIRYNETSARRGRMAGCNCERAPRGAQ